MKLRRVKITTGKEALVTKHIGQYNYVLDFVDFNDINIHEIKLNRQDNSSKIRTDFYYKVYSSNPDSVLIKSNKGKNEYQLTEPIIMENGFSVFNVVDSSNNKYKLGICNTKAYIINTKSDSCIKYFIH